MNRRNAIRAAIVAGLVPAAAIPKSREDEKRELLLKVASLGLSVDEQHDMIILVMAVSDGDRIGNQQAASIDEIRSGMPVSEIRKRATARTNHALYGPGGRFAKDGER